MLAAKFPVPMVVGPHPFPFRTRQLSPLTPMVLQPQGCWESRKAPDYSNEPVARDRGRLFDLSATGIEDTGHSAVIYSPVARSRAVRPDRAKVVAAQRITRSPAAVDRFR